MPRLKGSRTTVAPAASACCAVSSVEPSSTTRTSKSGAWWRIDSTTAVTVADSLYAGTTARDERVVLMGEKALAGKTRAGPPKLRSPAAAALMLVGWTGPYAGAMLARVPAPLALLLVVTLIEALAWTFANPPLQDADEAGHVAYVQKIVDGHAIPWGRRAPLGRDAPRQFSTELRTAALWSGLEPLRGNLHARPLWTGADELLWQSADDPLAGGARPDCARTGAFRQP